MIRLILFFPVLLFGAFSGQIIDQSSGLSIANASVSDKFISVKSDVNGTFTIDTNASHLHIKAHGYRPKQIEVLPYYTQHTLTSIDVKALYLSFWGARIDSKTLKRILKIIDETEVNAIVVDVKNEFGLTSYKTDVPMVNRNGVWYKRTIKDMQAFMDLMKSKEIYMIARVVVFKDEIQAVNHPERALKLENGEIWRNKEKMAWVDPFNEEAHQYTLSIAEDAAKVGFDEINFDYIRFPAKADLLYSKEYNQQNRISAIGTFLKSASETLRPYGTFISVDTYGYVCWNENDTNIGQTVESLARYADYLAPMLYPSGFDPQTMGFDDPTKHSYEVVSRSILRMHEYVEPVRVRPWLQAFKDYAHGRKHFKEERIAEQIRAANDTQTSGWMFWNPSSLYKHFNKKLFEEHLAPEGIRLMPKDKPIFEEQSDKNEMKSLIYEAG